MSDKILIDKAVLKQALEAMRDWCHSFPDAKSLTDQCVINALREALAATQPAQPAEPVAWMHRLDAAGDHRGVFTATFDSSSPGFSVPLYLAPQPQRQPLTDKQIIDKLMFLSPGCRDDLIAFARAIEAAHGIGKGPAA